MAANKCSECSASFSRLARPTLCSKCRKPLCGTCARKYPLIPFDESEGGEAVEISKQNIQSFCKDCFEETSTVDFSKTHDVIGPENSETVIVLVHGAGGNRALLRPHARLLAEAGFKCILPDLPGHGSLADTKLTLESCTSAIRKVLDENGLKPGDRVIYLGVSFGAYIGFDILDRLQNSFAGAVLLDGGHNFGPGANLIVRVAVRFVKVLSANASNRFLMTLFTSVLSKLAADFHLVKSMFGAGMCFEQFPALWDCVRAIAPGDKIPNFRFPVLFLNGGDDFRDSEDRWLALCRMKERSSLKVFDGGDHFFTHDSRFVKDVIDSVVSFAHQPSLAS